MQILEFDQAVCAPAICLNSDWMDARTQGRRL
jgi:hypothetical protein